ncbi:MAG: response regulator [Nitrospirae bacterium]|nr:MAG: response regulator [Nitrospirota bacterium]
MKGIGVRLLIAGILLSLLVSGGIFLHESREREEFVQTLYRTDLEEKVGYIKGVLSRRMIEDNIPLLKKDLSEIEKAGLLSGLTIFRSDGEVWISDGAPIPISRGISAPPCNTCHQGGEDDPSFMVFSYPLEAKGKCKKCHHGDSGTIGVVSGVINTGEIAHIKKDLMGDMLFLLLIVLGMISAAGIIIHGWVVRRLMGLKDAISGFSRGEFRPVSESGGDEIALIGRAFNRMAREVIQARSEVEASENYLRNLINNISDMVIVLDRDYRIRFLNRLALEYLGVSDEKEVIGMPCHRAFHGSDVPCPEVGGAVADECGVEDAFSGQSRYTIHTHYDESGPRYIYVRFIPFRVGADIPFVIEMARDVTENYRLNERTRILADVGKGLQGVDSMEEFFERLVELGKSSFQAHASNVYMIDPMEGRLYRQTSPSVHGDELVEALREMDIDECVSGLAIHTGMPNVAETIEEFPEGRLLPLIKKAGFETIVSIPLMRDARVVGVYNIAWKNRRVYRKGDIPFFEVLQELINRTFNRIITQSSLVLETERVRTLSDLITSISEKEGLEETLRIIVRAARRLLHADICGVFIYTEDGETLRLVSLEGGDRENLTGRFEVRADELNLELDRENNTFSSINVFEDERFSPVRTVAERYGFRSVYGRCLFSREGRKMGIIFGLWREERLPLLDEISLFNAFSDSAEIAINKAFLIDELRKEKQKVIDIFNSISDPIFVTTRDFTITMANRAFHKLVGDEHPEGKKCFQVVHQRGMPDVECPHYETVHTGGLSVSERTSEGMSYIYTTSPMHDAKGDVTGVIHLIKDISFLREMEAERESLKEQLLHAQKLESIGNLAGGIAHDFNNLLTAVLGHTELAMIKAEDEGFRKNLAVIKEAAEKARDLTRQLLLYGRKTPMDRRVQDLNEIMEGTIKMIRRMIGEEIEVKMELAESPLLVNVDRTQISQVIMNLCVNARDAMPDGGTLLIRTGKGNPPADGLFPPGRKPDSNAEMVFFSVTDTGVGIPEEIRENIFEPFFTTKQEGRGTGLGLSVVYSVVDTHEGFLHLRSGEGEGTSFTVFLKEAEIRKGTSRDGGNGGSLPRGNERVLLVDDDEFIRDTGKKLLESLGYRVTVAASGKEGYEAFMREDGGFEVVLSDLRMPGMKGTELFEKLREADGDLRFIIITGYGRQEIEDSLLYRIHGVIEKPFNIRELAYKVRYALDEGRERVRGES